MTTRKTPNPVKRFILGFSAPLRGAGFLLKHPRLLKYTIIPTIINIVLVVSFYLLSMFFLLRLLDRWIPAADAWYWGILSWIVAILLMLVFLLVAVVFFYIIAGVIYVPFNELLSIKVEELIKKNRRDETFSIRVMTLDIWLSITNELKRTFLYLTTMGALFVLNLLPVVGSGIYIIIAGVITPLFLAYDFMDHPLGRRRLLFREKRKFIAKNFITMMGFGVAVFIFLFIPFINFVMLPLNAAGATLLFCEIERWQGEIAYRDVRPLLSKKGLRQ